MPNLKALKALTYPIVPRRRTAAIVNAFAAMSYQAQTYHTTYQDIPIYKWPTDLWTYQNLIWKVKPDLIVETGTFRGASALYMANQLDLIGDGQVITIDVEKHGEPPTHQRITHIVGSSVSDEVADRVQRAAGVSRRVLVILDSDHSEAHVTAELNIYADLVTPGSYCIVEDTIANGHPALPNFGPGPMEAARRFVARRNDFAVDRSCEYFFLTQNPEGFLVRSA